MVAPKARPFLASALQDMKAKRFQQARLNLQIALGHDPENEELRALLAEAEAKGSEGAR
jgi:hypothetical protein